MNIRHMGNQVRKERRIPGRIRRARVNRFNKTDESNENAHEQKKTNNNDPNIL
jgi:hypothetical protein